MADDTNNDSNFTIDTVDVETEGADRTYYVKVDRTADDSDDTLVEYLRLGAASDDAMYDSTTLMETYALDRFNDGNMLTDFDDEIGDAGIFEYTSGDEFEVVEGNSFKRIHGNAYAIYGQLHEIFEDAGIANGVTAGLFGEGIEYTMSKATTFTAALAADLNFTGGFEYDANTSASLSSTTGVGLNLSLGSAIDVTHALKAEFSANGGFDYPSAGLNHSEKPVYFGEDSITLGLDEDPIRGLLKGALGTLAGLMQAADVAFNANGVVAGLSIDRFNEKPEAIQQHVSAAQVIAVTQASLALVASVLCLIAGSAQSKKAKALSLNLDRKPFVRIKHDGMIAPKTNKITLDTGQGASIELNEDKITIKAAEVLVSTNDAAIPRGITIHSGEKLNLESRTAMDIVSGAATKLESKSGDLTIDAGAKSIKSTAAKWKQTGEFEAGKTKLGDVTATSIKLNGVPVATTTNVAHTARALSTDIDELKKDVSTIAWQAFADDLLSLMMI